MASIYGSHTNPANQTKRSVIQEAATDKQTIDSENSPCLINNIFKAKYIVINNCIFNL